MTWTIPVCRLWIAMNRLKTEWSAVGIFPMSVNWRCVLTNSFPFYWCQRSACLFYICAHFLNSIVVFETKSHRYQGGCEDIKEKIFCLGRAILSWWRMMINICRFKCIKMKINKGLAIVCKQQHKYCCDESTEKWKEFFAVISHVPHNDSHDF